MDESEHLVREEKPASRTACSVIVCLGHLRRQIKGQKAIATSHLCNDCHKVGGRGLVVQSLTRFNSKDTAVPIDGKLGKR